MFLGCVSLLEKQQRQSLSVDDAVGKLDEKYLKICGDFRTKQGVNTEIPDH